MADPPSEDLPTIAALERRVAALEERRPRGTSRTDSRIPPLATNFDIEDAVFSPSSVGAIKKSPESVTNSTTLQDDDELLLPIRVGERLGFEFFLIWRAHTDGDFRVSITVPTGAAGDWAVSRNVGATTIYPTYHGNVAFSDPIAVYAEVTNTKYGLHIFGAVLNGATPGHVTLQWCQNAADATATIVYNYSWARGTRLA